MWTVPNILLTIFGLVLMVTPLALWVAWTTTIFTGVLVAALISLIGAVIVTRTKDENSAD
jgi:ABC-type phosphate transport system permease subunit